MHGTRSRLYLIENDDDNNDDNNNDDDDNNNNNDDEDNYSSNSVNFQARTSRFGMKVCLDNTYNMMIMKMTIMILMMMMMVMMIKMIIAITQSILKLGPPDFSWKYISRISNRYYLDLLPCKIWRS